jgi:hypothetical protein
MPKKPSTPEQHKLHIARATLRMPDAMAAVMGGPSKAQAQATLVAHGVAEYKPIFRVSYTERGRAEHTGMYFDREACIQTLGSFRRAGRAWLQESKDNGRTWQTVNV